MIYDCFTFFNELDLLEIRLNVLKDVVDKFVLVESTRTFTNREKPLFYADNKSRFDSFSDRIVHVVLDNFPPFKTAWHYESIQRNAIVRGLTEAKDDDVILIGDVDEIPRPELVAKHCHDQGIVIFDQDYYAYFLNFRNVRQQWWCGTKMMSYRLFTHAFDHVKSSVINEFLPEELNKGTTPSRIRMRTPPKRVCRTKVVRHGGWHFTSLGGAERLVEKMRSFSHQEYNIGEDRIVLAEFDKLIRDGKGPFWEMRCFADPIDERLPCYVVDNASRYARYLIPYSPEEANTRRLDRLFQTIRGCVIGLLERGCPEVLHNALHSIKRLLLGRKACRISA